MSINQKQLSYGARFFDRIDRQEKGDEMKTFIIKFEYLSADSDDVRNTYAIVNSRNENIAIGNIKAELSKYCMKFVRLCNIETMSCNSEDMIIFNII